MARASRWLLPRHRQRHRRASELDMKNKTLGVIACWLAGSGSTVWAQVPQYEECESSPACLLLFEQAKQQSKAGLLSEALDSYKLAYGVKKDPRLLFSIARVLDKQEKSLEAVFHYRRFINSPVADEEQKTKAWEYLTELEGPDRTLSLDVKVVGPGRVTSQPAGITCNSGSVCSQTFQKTSEHRSVTLLAEPKGAASLVVWSDAPCGPQVLTNPRQCDLPIRGRLNITARFERPLGRKLATGAFGVLAGAGLIGSALMIAYNGRYVSGDGISKDSVYAFLPGPLSASVGLTVGFSLGATLVWLLPTKQARIP